jgi:hypothetical protein
MGVNFNPDCWSDPAHVELTPMPMGNNAMVSVHAAITVERLIRRFFMVVLRGRSPGTLVEYE